MANSNFSQQINELEVLAYANIKDSTNTFVTTANPREDLLYASKSYNISAIRPQVVKFIENLSVFNPTGKWNFTQGINIAERTFTAAMKAGLSATLLPKHFLEEDFNNLLNVLSNDLYKNNHIPSAVGEIIFSTTLKTESEVKKIYGSYTSWKQVPGRFILGANIGNSNKVSNAMRTVLRNANIKAGAAMQTPTINEIPQHSHVFDAADNAKTLKVSQTVNCTDSKTETSPAEYSSSITKTNGGRLISRSRIRLNPGSEASLDKVLSANGGKGVPNHGPSASDGDCGASDFQKPGLTISYEIKDEGKIYGNSGATATIKENTTPKNGAHSNMPPFYTVYMWERIN